MSGLQRYLLIADDFALSASVSSGITELAKNRRLSGASALTTTAEWSAGAGLARGLRPLISLGLHLNLTHGAPVGAMPMQAPEGCLPPPSAWIARALTGRISIVEVEAEFHRQFDAFEFGAGALPDHVDGHHHIHVLPGVREALARTLRRRYPAGRLPLVRLPVDRPERCVARRACVQKALVVAALSVGARSRFHAIGAPVNGGFSGFSHFNSGTSYAAELLRFEQRTGRNHMIMCHPGHSDPELAALDHVSDRRAEELAALSADPTLPSRIRHPARHRNAAGFIDWSAALAE